MNVFDLFIQKCIQLHALEERKAWQNFPYIYNGTYWGAALYDKMWNYIPVWEVIIRYLKNVGQIR